MNFALPKDKGKFQGNYKIIQYCHRPCFLGQYLFQFSGRFVRNVQMNENTIQTFLIIPISGIF